MLTADTITTIMITISVIYCVVAIAGIIIVLDKTNRLNRDINELRKSVKDKSYASYQR